MKKIKKCNPYVSQGLDVVVLCAFNQALPGVCFVSGFTVFMVNNKYGYMDSKFCDTEK